MELLRPILELGVVIPGMLLAYFPAKSSLKQPLSKLVLWLTSGSTQNTYQVCAKFSSSTILRTLCVAG